MQTSDVIAQSQPSGVPNLKQCDGSWGSNNLGTCSYTICSAGCAITSVAMVFKYFGVDTDPGRLNTWLTNNGGFSGGCYIIWSTAVNIGSGFTYIGNPGQDFNRLRSELDAGYPVIVEVNNNGQHFVVVTGYSGDTYYINDPAYTSRTTLASYGNSFVGMRIYHGGFSGSCHSLTRNHTGTGSDPSASPSNSSGCSSGQYKSGESITLTANPASGWHFESWSGTDNSSSSHFSMPTPLQTHTPSGWLRWRVTCSTRRGHRSCPRFAFGIACSSASSSCCR